MQEAEMLFPLTTPIPNVSNWSVDGVLSSVKLAKANRLVMNDIDNFTEPHTNDEDLSSTAKQGTNVKSNKFCDMLESLIRRTVCSTVLTNGVIKNTVIFSLNGSAFQVLQSFIHAILHFRLWNFLRETCIDISPLFGYERKIYTTPAEGSFHFLVKYRKETIEFIFDGRSSWFHGWITEDGAYECEPPAGSEPYLKHLCKKLKILDFTGNYIHVAPNDNAGLINIGLSALRRTFTILRWSRGMWSMELQYAIGTWVLYLGESPKFHRVFLCCCRAIMDRTIINLDAYDRSLGLLVRKWGKLCEPAVRYLLACLGSKKKMDLKSKINGIVCFKIPGIESVDDVLRNVCIWTYGSPRKCIKVDNSVTSYKEDEYDISEEPAAVKQMISSGVLSGEEPQSTLAELVERQGPAIFKASTWQSHLPPLRHTGPLVSKSTMFRGSRSFSICVSPLQGCSPLRAFFMNKFVACTPAVASPLQGCSPLRAFSPAISTWTSPLQHLNGLLGSPLDRERTFCAVARRMLSVLKNAR